ncbi:CCA tRNA nucleotidyltransferase [Sphingomonas sp. BGYR3]|uniref:CCA tRNA nucleotidyltransferase n=1 Tax=Sphingomonas sp. BGYR3 TaxID=2975483 RepID=UPI0021A42E54|nr:CCA tRNA nucleotidyltransferase [Sphingomonas sp. BGYR3]MDG5487073.1 CCA tRNA nucleotidyltransferase [Sphingomonas sp. BGYR3]
MTPTHLPPAPWRERSGLAALTRIIGAEQGESRYVGGAVRDTILGLPVADIDIATRLLPEAVMARLKEADIRVVPTGIAHGTVTAVLDSGPIEITTLRRDVSTDGRHATIAYSTDWREDAARRDFTINALYADPVSGEIHDYFGGLDDLAVRQVRFIGDALTRIAEDHLRILRFFRFLARFGDAPDAEGLAACVARANDLMALSRERVAAEMLKLLVAPRAVETMALMYASGIFAPVLPEIDASGIAALPRLIAAEDAAGVAPDPVRRLTAVLPRDAKAVEGVAARLRLSNAQRKRMASAIVPLDDAPRPLASRIGVELATDRLLLNDDAEGARAIADWMPPRLPVSGGTLIELGLSRGPDVAAALKRTERRWLDEGFPDDERAMAIARDVVDQLLRERRNDSASAGGSGRE